MKPSSSRLLAGVHSRLVLDAISVLLLLSLVACSSGKPASAATPPLDADLPYLARPARLSAPALSLPPSVPAVQAAPASDSLGDTTWLGNPLPNGNSYALVAVTRAEALDRAAGVYSPLPLSRVGVWYDRVKPCHTPGTLVCSPCSVRTQYA
jgi:hypothetical protein